MLKNLILLLLCLNLSQALNPFTVIGPSQVNANISYNINLNGQQPTSLLLKIFGFYNTTAQNILMTTSNPPYTSTIDSNGNTLLSFQLNPTQQIQTINLNIQANINYLKWIGFGGVNPEFLQSSTYVILNPETTQTALQIIGNVTNPFEKIILLTSWVHNNIKYQGAGLSTVIMNSSWVLQNRVGKCSEFTHLFIALARSIGVPAKFIAGLVFNGNSWALHAWAEVYINNQWYPVDPTFDEALILDNTHVEMAEGVDQSAVNNILTGTGNFDLNSVTLTSNLNATLENFSNFSVISVKIQTPNQPVGSNSFETIKATVKNNLNQAIATPLFISVPEGVTLLSPADQLVYLPPFESQTITWNILTPQMKNNYLYNYTINVNYLGGYQEAFFEGDNQAKIKTVEGFQLSPLIIYQNDTNLNLISTISNTGSETLNLTQIAVLGSQNLNNQLSLNPGSQTQQHYSFTIPNSNENGSLITIWNGTNYTQNFYINIQQSTRTPQQENSTPVQPQQLVFNLNPLLIGLTATFLFLIVLLILKKITRS